MNQAAAAVKRERVRPDLPGAIWRPASSCWSYSAKTHKGTCAHNAVNSLIPKMVN